LFSTVAIASAPTTKRSGGSCWPMSWTSAPASLAGSLAFESFALAADPSQSLLTYTADPRLPSQETLSLLASWAASTAHDNHPSTHEDQQERRKTGSTTGATTCAAGPPPGPATPDENPNRHLTRHHGGTRAEHGGAGDRRGAPEPGIGEHDVLVQVRAASVNLLDAKIRDG
jgi:hypothetical protein